MEILSSGAVFLRYHLGGLLGRRDMLGQVLHQLPQQTRLHVEPMYAVARCGGLSEPLDDCCHKADAEFVGIGGDALHLGRLVGAVRTLCTLPTSWLLLPIGRESSLRQLGPSP